MGSGVGSGIKGGLWLLVFTLACAGVQQRSNADEGSSCEHPVVLSEADDDGQAVTQEYAYLAKRYPGSHSASQALLSTCNGKPVTQDRVAILTAEGQKVVVFFQLPARSDAR